MAAESKIPLKFHFNLSIKKKIAQKLHSQFIGWIMKRVKSVLSTFFNVNLQALKMELSRREC